MSVIRIKRRENHFAQIDRGILQDPRLSYQAIGLAAYLFSKPDGWEVRINDLVKPTIIEGKNRPVNGVESVRSSLKELQREGYARLITNRNPETGEVMGKSWEVGEVKHESTEKQEVAPTSGKSRHRENPDVGKTPTTKEVSKDTSNKESVFPFASFWDAYDYKKGRAKCEKKYAKVSEADRQQIKDTLPAYISETCIEESTKGWKPRRKYPLTYLNGRVWEDYIGKAAEKQDTTELTPEQKQAYDRYLEWVKATHPDAITTVKYLSARQFIQYQNYKAHMTPHTKYQFLLIAHRRWETDKSREVYQLFEEKMAEFKKQMA